MSQQPLPWHGPKPATDAELAGHKLPCDVQVGTVIFRAGVPLLDLVKAMRSYQQRAWPDGRGNATTPAATQDTAVRR